MALGLVDPADGSFFDVNEPFARLLDHPRAQLVGRRWQDLTHPDDLGNDAESMRALARGELQTLDRIKRFRRIDGTNVWSRVRVVRAAAPEAGRAMNWVWVEELGSAAEGLRQAADLRLREYSAQLEAASAAKSVFLANMSHEIRTPLGVISGLADLLRRDAANPRQARRLNQLFDTTQHVLGVVNDILDLSKIEAGELALASEAFSLDAVVDRVRRLFGGQAREKGLEFSVRLDAALRSVPLRGDPLRLSQVLINLCSNAVKFTERGSVVVTIEARGIHEAGVWLRCAVADTGPGVPLELRPQLFQPFVQGDVTTARRYGGTGLGLAIVHRLVTLMDGSLTLDSEAGRGSTFAFEIWLPRAGGATIDVADSEGGTDADLSGQRILLAEDHPLSQEILCEMLETLGCEVLIASDGAEAVELASTCRHDLILMDMQMPGMDGLEATRRIRHLPGCGQLPIIALTANVLVEDRQRCLEAGMNDHLGKPTTQAGLARAIQRWLPGLPRTAARGEPAPAAHVPAQPHAAETDAALLAALSALQGVRVDAAWRASTVRLRSYQELLARFAQTQAQEAEQVREHLSAGRVEAARQTVHALAGAAGMVGARAVMVRARAIEEALRLGQEPQGLVTQAVHCQAEIEALGAALARLEQSPVAER
jgi:two-component system sensor histidine kinase/response regulator